MKKLWYILPLFLFFLVGCGSKSEGDKELYDSFKSAYITDLKSFDEEFDRETLKNVGLDVNDLNDYPLSMYDMGDGEYATIFDTSEGNREFVGYRQKDNFIFVIQSENKILDLIENSKPVYTQNNFDLFKSNE